MKDFLHKTEPKTRRCRCHSGYSWAMRRAGIIAFCIGIGHLLYERAWIKNKNLSTTYDVPVDLHAIILIVLKFVV